MRPKRAALGQSELPSAAAAAQDQPASANDGIDAEDAEANSDEQVGMQIRGGCDMRS